MTITESLATILPDIRHLLAIDVDILIDPAWSAGHRLELRRAIADRYAAPAPAAPGAAPAASAPRPPADAPHAALDRDALLMLDALPPASVSISHTPRLGGFAFNPRGAVGFDIEESARVQPHVVSRVAKPGELAQAPSPAHLWTAKEAAFKLARGKTKIISALHTAKWRSVVTRENLSLWSCEVLEESSMIGASVEIQNTTLSIFIYRP